MVADIHKKKIRNVVIEAHIVRRKISLLIDEIRIQFAEKIYLNYVMLACQVCGNILHIIAFTYHIRCI